MKFTWGTGILIFLIVFLFACGIFIAFAMNQDLNLVHEEYYQKGANYTTQMEINKRSAKFKNIIYIKDKADKILIFFPNGFYDNLKNGTILFFRPSDSNIDIGFDMNITTNVQSIAKSKLKKGRYIVQLSWHSDEDYYIEKEFFVK